MTTTLQPVQALVPGANLEAYVQTVNSLPLLTVEQERELAELDKLAASMNLVVEKPMLMPMAAAPALVSLHA